MGAKRYGLHLENQYQEELEIFWNPYKKEYCFYCGDIVWRYCEIDERWETIGIVDYMKKPPYTKYYKFICEVKL